MLESTAEDGIKQNRAVMKVQDSTRDRTGRVEAGRDEADKIRQGRAGQRCT